MLVDYALAFVHITAFSIAKATKAVLVNVTGAAGPPDLANLEKDEEGETATAQEFYGALGRIAAPRRPTKVGKDTLKVEAVALRRADGLVPIAARDLRLHAFFPNPKEGTIADVGYAGAFDSDEPAFNPDGTPKSSTWTRYIPYAFVNGVPTKAHVISIDGTAGNESISIVHGEGMAVLMKSGGKNSLTVKNKAGAVYIEVNDDGAVINGNTVINGGATIGSPVGALPAAIATPLVSYLTQFEAAVKVALVALDALIPGTSAIFQTAMTAAAPALAATPAIKTSIA